MCQPDLIEDAPLEHESEFAGKDDAEYLELQIEAPEPHTSRPAPRPQPRPEPVRRSQTLILEWDNVLYQDVMSAISEQEKHLETRSSEMVSYRRSLRKTLRWAGYAAALALLLLFIPVSVVLLREPSTRSAYLALLLCLLGGAGWACYEVSSR